MKSDFKKAYAKKKKTGTIWENLKTLAPVKEKKLKLKLPSKDTGKKRGRPVGSKNKSTGRKAPPGGFKSSEFIDPKDDEDTPKKRGRGRPKGAKNKAKVRGNTTNPNAPSFKSFMAKKKEGITHSKFKGEASEADIAKYSSAPAKRGRGRPKGAKNKPKGGITHSKFKGEASEADIAKYSTAPEKKARKVRSDKGVKRGKRTKVI